MLSYHLENLLVYITEKTLAPPIENATVKETNLKIKNLKLFHKTPKNKQFLKIFPFTSGKKQFDEKKRRWKLFFCKIFFKKMSLFISKINFIIRNKIFR